MPRRPRIHLDGVPLHIVQRGHNREPCFFAEEDYHAYRLLAGRGGDRRHPPRTQPAPAAGQRALSRAHRAHDRPAARSQAARQAAAGTGRGCRHSVWTGGAGVVTPGEGLRVSPFFLVGSRAEAIPLSIAASLQRESLQSTGRAALDPPDARSALCRLCCAKPSRSPPHSPPRSRAGRHQAARHVAPRAVPIIRQFNGWPA